MASQSQFEEKAYIALLGLAEHFRATKNIRKSIQCLEAVSVYIFQDLIQNIQFEITFSLAVICISRIVEKG